ncbi:hypothetical protein [Formosa sp. A9]|uniref:hypothetical protein n=1 Tax=Formosa sp. A9 TaxID=3442641 RepID=UPI003EBA9B3B
MNKEFQKYSDITPEMNQEWEAKYGKTRLIDLEVQISDTETFNFVLRKPDRPVLEAIGRHAANKDVAAANKTLINNCVLGGDMEALNKDGEVYLEVLEQLNLLKHKAKSTVKKR